MTDASKIPVIVLEEHYWDAELAAHFTGAGASRAAKIESRLRDFGGDRIRDMDVAGIDISILSHGSPSAQNIPADIGPALVRRVNDRLIAAINASDGRFGGFAALPTAAPEAAAEELERAVTLGLKGAMVHGLCLGEFLDLPKFWPIYECAERLGVPIYMHPGQPHPAVVAAYYGDYIDDFPMLPRPAWGYAVEAGTQAIRMVLSGVFDRYPNLKIILGHLGESIPFQLWRIDSALCRAGQKPITFREVFRRNFWITTSGFFSTPALQCSIAELGVDRIMFSVDWPFVDDSAAPARWLKTAPLEPEDRQKILGRTAQTLLNI